MNKKRLTLVFCLLGILLITAIIVFIIEFSRPKTRNQQIVGDTANFNAEDEIKIIGLTIEKEPDKTTYYVGDYSRDIDLSGMRLIYVYQKGNEIIHELVDNIYVANSIRFDHEGSYTIPIQCQYGTVTIEIKTVMPPISRLQVNRNPTKTEYYVGDSPDITGLALGAIYENEYYRENIQNFTCRSPQVFTEVGTQDIVVEYTENGKTVTINIPVNVKKPIPVSVAISTYPNRMQYFEYDTLDLTGLKLNVTYNSGKVVEKSEGFSSEQTILENEGMQQIIVKYKEDDVILQVAFNVQVQKRVLTYILLKTYPTKVQYIVGEDLDITGLTIEAKYNNNTSKVMNSGFEYTPKNLTKEGNQVITINYTENNVKTVLSFSVTVYPVVINSNVYEVGEKEIRKIQPKTKSRQLKNNITSNTNIKITNNENEVSDEAFLATGMTANGYKIIVTGDTNGDGKADIQDILNINKHRLNKTKLENEYLKAGDVTGDGKVDIQDILKINKYRLNKISEI